MGAGLAVVLCGILAIRSLQLCLTGNSPERVKMIKALGGDVMLIPQADGEPGK